MILGLTGRKQAGKNAVAKALAAHSPLPVVEVSFAALLKQSAAAVLGVTVEQLEGWKNNPHAVVSVGIGVEDGWLVEARTQTVRQFLQAYGTEGHREVFGEDFWLDAALPLDDDVPLYPGGRYAAALYVVTDVRFENEAQRVKDLGGHIVRVVGPNDVELETDSHASEEPLPSSLIDFYLTNARRDDNFADLYYRVRLLLGLLTEKAA
jgi:hypothetical protein